MAKIERLKGGTCGTRTAKITEYQPRRRTLGGDIFVSGLVDLAVIDIRVFVGESDSFDVIRSKEHSGTGKEGIESDRTWSNENRVVVCG